MTIKGKAYIAGVYEHPTRHAPDKSVAQLHAEVALGALADAGLTRDDVDGFFCAGDAPGPGPASMAEYFNLTKLRHVDSTELGGTSYVALAGHAAAAIALGKCDVALITLAGRPRAEGRPGAGIDPGGNPIPARRVRSATPSLAKRTSPVPPSWSLVFQRILAVPALKAGLRGFPLRAKQSRLRYFQENVVRRFRRASALPSTCPLQQ